MINHNVSLLRRIAFWALAWYWAVPTRLIAVLFADSVLLRWNGTVALMVATLSLVLDFSKAPLVTRRENTGVKLTLFFIFATSCGLLSGSPVSWFLPLPYMFLLISGLLLRPTADELRILGAAFFVGCFFELLAGMYAATTTSQLMVWGGESLAGLHEQTGRVGGLRGDANTYARQMASAACLLFFVATRQKNFVRKIVIACLGIFFVSGLFLSVSRGGMLTLAGGVLCILFFLPEKKKLYGLLQVSLSIGITVFVISSSMNNWQPFQYAGMTYQTRLLRDSRSYVWGQYFRLPPWEYLWFGVGWKGIAVRHQNGMTSTPYMPTSGMAHNMYLQQLHEGGIIGLGAYLALIFFALKGLRKTSRESPSGSVREVGSGMLLLLITQLIGGLTLSETERLIFFLIGLSFSTISANRSVAVDPYLMLDRGVGLLDGPEVSGPKG